MGGPRRKRETRAREGPHPTEYSNVYDLANGKIHLYHFHDFENVVVLDVAEEIPKGARTVEIARSLGIPALAAGTVEAGAKQVVIEPIGVTFGADELQLR